MVRLRASLGVHVGVIVRVGVVPTKDVDTAREHVALRIDSAVAVSGTCSPNGHIIIPDGTAYSGPVQLSRYIARRRPEAITVDSLVN